MTKLLVLVLFPLVSLTSLASSQVIPLPSKPPKGQVTPLPIEKPEVRKVYAEGIATIYEGNVESARKAALRQAYADAVGMVSGTEIKSMSLIRNFKYVSTVVLSRSRGFIREFNILRDKISDKDPSKYEISIEAEVVEKGKSPESDIDGLRLYLEVLGNPQLLIILPQHVISPAASELAEAKKDKINVEYEDKETKLKVSKESASLKKDASGTQVQTDTGENLRNAEAAIAQAFIRYGYNVITSDELIAEHYCTQEDLDKARAGVTAKITEIARAANIDLALFGQMNVVQQINREPYGGNLIAKVTTEASASAIVVSSGAKIDVYHGAQSKGDLTMLKAYSDSLDIAANNIADALAWKIPQYLADHYRETRLILSPLDYKKAEDVRNVLRGISGVENVRYGRTPTENNPRAEYVLLSGFISIEPDEILAVCEKVLGTSLSIVKASKFEIECEIKFR